MQAKMAASVQIATKAWPRKFDVFGTGISAVSNDEVLALLEQRSPDHAIRINLCNVHSVMSARTNRALADAFRDAELNVPDGMPVAWAIRTSGVVEQSRVRGADLAASAFDYGRARGWRHFFYGATEVTLARLVNNVSRTYPGIEIAGTFAPPFRPLRRDEVTDVVESIKRTGAHIVWVGLGMPKQELWMHAMRGSLPNIATIGIGAAFDFLAGTKADAPRWMQDAGLEWMHRLATEPRRLWRRYAWNNPLFMMLWARELLVRARASTPAPSSKR